MEWERSVFISGWNKNKPHVLIVQSRQWCLKIIAHSKHLSYIISSRSCLSWHQHLRVWQAVCFNTQWRLCPFSFEGHYTSTQTESAIGLDTWGKDYNSRSQWAYEADLSYSSIQTLSSATLKYPLWFGANNKGCSAQCGRMADNFEMINTMQEKNLSTQTCKHGQSLNWNNI